MAVLLIHVPYVNIYPCETCRPRFAAKPQSAHFHNSAMAKTGHERRPDMVVKQTDVNEWTLRAKLGAARLRPTRQRLALSALIFGRGDRHMAAEDLHREALDDGIKVSLATVYNTLHQFNEAGLLRVLAVEGSRTYFDTNTSDHHHFFIEDTNEVIDVPVNGVHIGQLPEPPEGMEIANVDVIVRLRRKTC